MQTQAAQPKSDTLQDSTKDNIGLGSNKTLLQKSNKVFYQQKETDKFTSSEKEVMEDCHKDPNNDLYKTHRQLELLFPDRHHTVEQIEKYLRKIRTKHQLLRETKSTIIKNQSQYVCTYVWEQKYNNGVKTPKNVKLEHKESLKSIRENAFLSGDSF